VPEQGRGDRGAEPGTRQECVRAPFQRHGEVDDVATVTPQRLRYGDGSSLRRVAALPGGSIDGTSGVAHAVEERPVIVTDCDGHADPSLRCGSLAARRSGPDNRTCYN
jgi:hypothetical protein